MSSNEKSAELTDVFIHQEGNDWVAYHAGNLIAKQEGMNCEKFYADLHVWIRKNEYHGPFWRVGADGNATEDVEIAKQAAKAFEGQNQAA